MRPAKAPAGGLSGHVEHSAARAARGRFSHDGSLIVMDWFCGAGGSSQGAHAVPGIEVKLAANHWPTAIASHEANFPGTIHWRGDIRDAPVEQWPIAHIFWASPECPKWSKARGKRQTFVNSQQGTLFGKKSDEEAAAERSRALMEEVPRYLRGVIARGGLVLAGVVENVIDCRDWDQWDRWLNEIRKLGYTIRVIALNSMHAQPRTTLWCPQTRDRLYVAYWHESLGRDPEWDKWLRPLAWCRDCDRQVQAIPVFKDPRKDMGKFGPQYVYRCPNVKCRNQIIKPPTLPALASIDQSVPGTPIGDRLKTPDKPEGFSPRTIGRIRAGIEEFWLEPLRRAIGADALPPLLVPSGGTWRDHAAPLSEPMPTRTTTESDGIVFPAPLLVPMEGRDGKPAIPADRASRTQTARAETGLVLPPFMIPMRGGGDAERARSLGAALHSVTAGGNHHGLVEPPLAPDVDMLLRLARQQDRTGTFSLDDVLFRMLDPAEIGRAMSFADDYVVLGSKRHKIRQYGNAVTPNVAEILVAALVEAITGEALSRFETTQFAA